MLFAHFGLFNGRGAWTAVTTPDTTANAVSVTEKSW